jgi:hypothetical protein
MFRYYNALTLSTKLASKNDTHMMSFLLKSSVLTKALATKQKSSADQWLSG